MKERVYDWVDVGAIEQPGERYRSPLASEELDAMRESIVRVGEEWSMDHPIAVNAVNGRLILRDGEKRLTLFRDLGHRRIFAVIRKFDDEGAAIEDAKWGSLEDNWHRGQRDPKQLIELLRRWTSGMNEGGAAKLLIEKGFSKGYAYKLARLVRDEELSERVMRGELSLRSAIELTGGETKVVSHVRPISEKPEKGVASGKEAKIEPHKSAQIQRRETSWRKPRREGKRGRPRKEEVPGLTARLKHELTRAFEKLGIKEESERERLMGEAVGALGPYPTGMQVRAVKRWREAGGGISFQQALVDVMREKAEGRVEALKPSPIEEEAKAGEEVEAALEGFRRELIKPYRAMGFKLREAKMIAEHPLVSRCYREFGPHVGYSLAVLLGGAAHWLYLKNMVERVEDPFERALSRLGEEDYRSIVERVVPRLKGASSNLAMPLILMLSSVKEVVELGDRRYLVLCDYSSVKIAEARDFYIENGRRLQADLVQLSLLKDFSGLVETLGGMRLDVIQVLLPEARGRVYTLRCPGCNSVLRCVVCGSPIVCWECGWPSTNLDEGKLIERRTFSRPERLAVRVE